LHGGHVTLLQVDINFLKNLMPGYKYCKAQQVMSDTLKKELLRHQADEGIEVLQLMTAMLSDYKLPSPESLARLDALNSKVLSKAFEVYSQQSKEAQLQKKDELHTKR
jgi:hypothetical protein